VVQPTVFKIYGEYEGVMIKTSNRIYTAHSTLYLYNWFEEIDKEKFIKGFDEFVNYIKRIR